MNDKLLSICIPTYNRAEVLDQTLQKLFSDPDFDENKIEVIVSDNCSDDNTERIIKKFPFVSYFRNQHNIRDKNFNKVLSYATGKYIRLFNDTLSFKKGALNLLLKKIENHLEEECNLFFYCNMFLNRDCTKFILGKEGLLNEASFYTTWIANFGCWRKDFLAIKNQNRYSELQFVQVDWCYKIVENNKQTIIYFDDFFDIRMPNKKGGYNIFDIFVNNYLYILKNQNFSFSLYEKEKYRLFRYFIYPWLIKLFIKEKNTYSFDISNVNKVLLKKYWYEPYFYVFYILFLIKKLI